MQQFVSMTSITKHFKNPQNKFACAHSKKYVIYQKTEHLKFSIKAEHFSYNSGHDKH